MARLGRRHAGIDLSERGGTGWDHGRRPGSGMAGDDIARPESNPATRTTQCGRHRPTRARRHRGRHRSDTMSTTYCITWPPLQHPRRNRVSGRWQLTRRRSIRSLPMFPITAIFVFCTGCARVLPEGMVAVLLANPSTPTRTRPPRTERSTPQPRAPPLTPPATSQSAPHPL